MASITKEIVIDARPERVWAVISDFAAGPRRMAPSFVVDVRLDGPDVRIVTFVDGTVLRERLIDLDDRARRLSYAITGDTVRPVHDNASFQVFAMGADRSRFVWIHDVLPADLVEHFSAGMDQGLSIFKRTLESQ